MIKVYITEEEFSLGPLGKYVWFQNNEYYDEIRIKLEGNNWDITEYGDGQIIFNK